MLRLALTFVLLILALEGEAASNVRVRTAAELRALLAENKRVKVPFVLTGVVDQEPHHPNNASMTLVDETGAVCIYAGSTIKGLDIRSGDRVTFSGWTAHYSSDQFLCGICATAKIHEHGTPPPVEDVTCADFADPRHDFRLVAVKGTVRNAFQDELDPNFIVLVINDGSASVYAFVPTVNCPQRPADLIGAEVRAVGRCDPLPVGSRRLIGRILMTIARDNVVILRTSERDAFDVPDIAQLRGRPTREILSSGRRKACGRVVTRWDGGQRLILKTSDGSLVNVELNTKAFPAVGSAVEVSGVPETDLIRVNLGSADWRPATRPPEETDTPCETTIPLLVADDQGRPQIHPQFHGRSVTLCGNVRNTITATPNDVRLVLEDEGFSLPVDVSACADVLAAAKLGARLRVTGTLVVETDTMRLLSSFPRIRGVLLVVRSPGDVTVVTAPPFWTPLRLAGVIGTLLAVLVGIVLWNLSLRTLVKRKTRELEREIVNGVEAELRVHERTRLATELHDSISQDLTGVALSLDAIGETIGVDDAETRNRLAVAARSLKSCRAELRNCLWDLRSDALEEPDIDTAIRRTLAPHVRDTNLVIRFRAVREAFSDHTLHTILCIIRELTVNAIRHGGARTVRIAGSQEEKELRFSVADDGCGFDPATRPNIDDGHFGLQGVQERAEALGGAMTLKSARGAGTKVTISIKLKTPAPDGKTTCQKSRS